MSKRPKICVCAGSSTPSDSAIMDAARTLGKQIAAAGYDLVYGGGTSGVMGAVAVAAQQAGGCVIAVTLEKYAHEAQVAGAMVQTILTEQERFSIFASYKPAAYFVLPGGPGSLREALQGLEEAVYDNGPDVVLVAVGNYLDGIRQYFDMAVAAGMIKTAKKDCLKMWYPGEALGTVLAAGGLSTVPAPPPAKNP